MGSTRVGSAAGTAFNGELVAGVRFAVAAARDGVRVVILLRFLLGFFGVSVGLILGRDDRRGCRRVLECSIRLSPDAFHGHDVDSVARNQGEGQKEEEDSYSCVHCVVLYRCQC